MSSIIKKRVIDLPILDFIEDDFSLYFCTLQSDYQATYKTLKDRIISDGNFLKINNNLSELVNSAASARLNLGLKTGALYDAGSGVGQVLLIDSYNGGASLPAIDGSRLTGLNIATGGISTNTAGDGLGITNANSLYVQADNQTIAVVNDKVSIMPSGVNSAQLAAGCVQGKNLASNIVDGTSIQIVNNQLTVATPFVVTDGIVGDYNTPSTDFYVSPPAGKTMANFLGGIVSVYEINTSAMSFAHGFDEDTVLHVSYTKGASSVAITAYMGPSYATGPANNRNIKANYHFLWS